MEATKQPHPPRTTPTIPEFVLSLLRKQIATGSPWEHSRWDSPPRPTTIEPQRVVITIGRCYAPRATTAVEGHEHVAIVADFDRHMVLVCWRAAWTYWAFGPIPVPEPTPTAMIAEGSDEASLILWLTPAVTR